MAPPFKIQSVEDTGPTDNSGDDSLWVAWIAEPGRAPERLLFSLAARFGPVTAEHMCELIGRQAQLFANDRGALAQFQELSVPHPDGQEERRAIVLRADILPQPARALRMC